MLLISLKRLIQRIPADAPLNPSSYLHCSIVSPIPWRKAREESVQIVALTHSETAREERLMPSGLGVDGAGGRGVRSCDGEVRGTMQNRSTLSIVNHCHPSEATRPALHAANPPRSLFRPYAGQAGNLIKRSWSRGLRQSGWREAVWWG